MTFFHLKLISYLCFRKCLPWFAWRKCRHPPMFTRVHTDPYVDIRMQPKICDCRHSSPWSYSRVAVAHYIFSFCVFLTVQPKTTNIGAFLDVVQLANNIMVHYCHQLEWIVDWEMWVRWGPSVTARVTPHAHPRNQYKSTAVHKTWKVCPSLKCLPCLVQRMEAHRMGIVVIRQLSGCGLLQNSILVICANLLFVTFICVFTVSVFLHLLSNPLVHHWLVLVLFISINK